jgi:hypothetical protein
MSCRCRVRMRLCSLSFLLLMRERGRRIYEREDGGYTGLKRQVHFNLTIAASNFSHTNTISTSY